MPIAIIILFVSSLIVMVILAGLVEMAPVLLVSLEKYPRKARLVDVLIFLCFGSVVVGILLLAVFNEENYISYRELPAETYELHEIQRDTYWRFEPDGETGTVVVYVVEPDGHVSEERYSENLVSFEDGVSPKISIVKRETYYSEKFCGLGFIGKPHEDKIFSVTITEPKVAKGKEVRESDKENFNGK